MPELAAPRREEYRRRPFRAPHRRRLLWVRLLRPLAGALILVGAPAALVVWSLSSPRFALRRIEVTGTSKVDPEWVREALAPLTGNQLLTVRLADVETHLATHPWILDLGIRKLPPDRLEVEVFERRPAAVVERAGELFFADRHGRTIAVYDPELQSEPLVAVDGGADAAAVAQAVELAGRWDRARPEWAGRLLRVEPAGDASFAAHAEKVPFALLVRANNLESSLARFTRFLPEVVRRYPRLDRVDLRFDTQIVIHPAAASRGREG